MICISHYEVIEQSIDAVADMLSNQDVIDNDIEVEVIWSAMMFLKNNPKATIQQACEHGVNEWIK